MKIILSIILLSSLALAEGPVRHAAKDGVALTKHVAKDTYAVTLKPLGKLGKWLIHK